ncbi:protein sprouty homolog 1-like [Lethenteron reissneri]|uniref:protein sprouty homolog 1-like n=1 Tax=Lethenteron reissneri TaxID=7753 RepID=UPI002AB6A8C0|nr:protein sprouty homolog 1-like [Lethenteron reissneri]XP_061408530.1 protein sprouty homolog 1-like [Lethenteron reissneri]XP_061408531.1 protein sprouty homolog 1-like [Lethenteron reissneri]
MDSRVWRQSDGGGGTGGGRTIVRHPRLLLQQQPPDESLAASPHSLVLSLDQIKAIRANNDYSEPPTVVRSNKPPHWGGGAVSSSSSPPQQHKERERPPSGETPRGAAPHKAAPPSRGGGAAQRPPPVPSRSASGGSTASRTSAGSAGSERRLLGGGAQHRQGPWEGIVVRGQPRAAAPAHGTTEPKREQQRRHRHDGHRHGEDGGDRKCEAGEGCGGGKEPCPERGQHACICERCGRCKCGECVAPRALPACWLCEKRCLCSADALLESCTCLCCVKALFYHCSDYGDGDSSDSWADKPCAGCSQSRCGLRWASMAALSLCLPCLLCYPPARGALKLCRAGYDRLTRPGCRCESSNSVRCKPPEVPPRKPI